MLDGVTYLAELARELPGQHVEQRHTSLYICFLSLSQMLQETLLFADIWVFPHIYPHPLAEKLSSCVFALLLGLGHFVLLTFCDLSILIYGHLWIFIGNFTSDLLLRGVG